MAAFRIIRRLRDLFDFTFGAPSDGDVVTYDSGTGDFVLAAPAASGAPASADYLVGTAQGGLSAEIVVGAAPGGELGGTWAAPTVDATHSGSSHASVQAAAEATAAAGLFAHTSDATDAHAGTAITNTPAGNIAATTAQGAINELDSEKAALAHAHAGEDISSGTVADARIDSAIARDAEVTAAVAAHEADTTAVHGIADTSLLALASAVPILAPAASTRNVIQPTGAAIVPFVVKGFASQSANLQQWQNSAGTVLSGVGASGQFILPLGVWHKDTAGADRLHMTAANTYHNADLHHFRSSAGVTIAQFSSSNGLIGLANIVATSYIRAADATANAVILGWDGTTAGPAISFGVAWDTTLARTAAGELTTQGKNGAIATKLIVKGVASQTAALQEWQTSAAAILASVTAAGLHKWAAANEQTTVGAAGAASALPATPTKYLKVVDSAGTTLVIPAYAAA